MSDHESNGALRPCACGDPECPAAKWIDLGHDVAMRWEPMRARVLLRHPAGALLEWLRAGDECHAMICLDSAEGLEVSGGHEKTWHLESFEPLTVSPSILCGCGWHGFIREGRWVPA
jgi:hypothetical protein